MRGKKLGSMVLAVSVGFSSLQRGPGNLRLQFSEARAKTRSEERGDPAGNLLVIGAVAAVLMLGLGAVAAGGGDDPPSGLDPKTTKKIDELFRKAKLSVEDAKIIMQAEKAGDIPAPIRKKLSQISSNLQKMMSNRSLVLPKNFIKIVEKGATKSAIIKTAGGAKVQGVLAKSGKSALAKTSTGIFIAMPVFFLAQDAFAASESADYSSKQGTTSSEEPLSHRLDD